MEKLACFSLLVGVEDDTIALENSMAVPPKIKGRITVCSGNSTSEYVESKISKSYWYTHIPSSTSDSGQELEACQMSTGG